MVRTDARPRGLRLQNEDTRLGSSCESKFAGEQPSIASAMSMPTIGVRGSEERASCGRMLRQGHNRMAQTAVKAKHGAYGPQRHELGQPAIESQGSVAAKIRHMESATALARVLCLLQPRRVVAQYRKPMEHMLCYCRQRAEAKDGQRNGPVGSRSSGARCTLAVLPSARRFGVRPAPMSAPDETDATPSGADPASTGIRLDNHVAGTVMAGGSSRLRGRTWAGPRGPLFVCRPPPASAPVRTRLSCRPDPRSARSRRSPAHCLPRYPTPLPTPRRPSPPRRWVHIRRPHNCPPLTHSAYSHQSDPFHPACFIAHTTPLCLLRARIRPPRRSSDHRRLSLGAFVAEHIGSWDTDSPLVVAQNM